MLNYNAPNVNGGGVKSTIDGADSDQMNTYVYLKAAIIDAKKEQYFSPLATAIDMPKNMGKTVKVYQYVPLLDDRNVNDQGIDANGVTIVDGNLYGSSRDIGTINGKMPVLTENGGRVNRVGFTRLMREGSIAFFGFFTEFTRESLDFDSDSGLMKHLSRELINGATQLTEAVLQKDLLNSAGTILYSGGAVSKETITGEEEVVGGATIPASVVTYKNLMRLDKILNDNRTPKQTQVITGSRLIDTKTIMGGRVAYIGSDLSIVIRGMTDLFDNPAFIAIQHYADAGTILNGEIGSVGPFRFVEVPEMLHWAAAGAVVDDNPGYQSSLDADGDERYDVFPIFVVGGDSFSTIGFQTDGKSFKFNIITKMPGNETADRNEPYGQTGFSSISWYYGLLVKRPERLGLILSVAPV